VRLVRILDSPVVLFIVCNQRLESNYKPFHRVFPLKNHILLNKIKALRFWMRTSYRIKLDTTIFKCFDLYNTRFDISSDPMTENLLLQVVAIALKAGQAIMEIYADPANAVMTKADNSPLTQADLAADHVISIGLKELNLGWPLLSEEVCANPLCGTL